MTKTLIAGGAGFIGSNLCNVLLEKGNHVICVDSLITSSRENIVEFEKNPNFTFIEFDVIKPLQELETQLEGVSEIYHLASPASPNQNSPRSYISFPFETMFVNSYGTHNLLELAKKLSARFLFASTSEVYGDPEVTPQPEDYFGNVNPNGIRSVYDESKRFGEAITMAYQRKFSLDVRIVRIFNTYGVNMQKDDGRVVSNFINQALENKPITIYGDGAQTRSFCYVSDLVDGLIKVMEKNQQSGIVVNLGNPIELTIQEIAEKIITMTGSSSQITHQDLPPDDPKQRRPDITRAMTVFGFDPVVNLDEGLAKTIEYFRGKGKA